MLVHRGLGDGTFGPPIRMRQEGVSGPVLLGDLDGDGRTDVIDGAVYLNRGGGTFEDAGRFAVNLRHTPVVGDVDDDGAADVLVVDGAGGVLLRRGLPGQPAAFEPPVAVDPGAVARDIAWLGGPGVAGLLAVVEAGRDAVGLYAWRDGRLVRIDERPAGTFPAQALAADVDRDGRADLVVRDAGDGTLSVYRRTGPSRSDAAGLAGPIAVPVGAGIADVAARDVDGDAFTDLVVADQPSGRVGVLRGTGGGGFAPARWYRAGVAPLTTQVEASATTVAGIELFVAVAAGRFAPGGSVGLVAAGAGTRQLNVLAGLGFGRLAAPVPLPDLAEVRSVGAADFNGDGLDDLAALAADGLDVYLADGRGGFGPRSRLAAGPDPGGLAVRDVDGDSRIDLLVGNSYGDILVLLGRGDGSFTPYRADQAVALAVADLDGDGRPEFVYANQALDRVAVEYGDSRTAVVGARADGMLSPGAVALEDLDGDGVTDLIVANTGSNHAPPLPDPLRQRRRAEALGDPRPPRLLRADRPQRHPRLPRRRHRLPRRGLAPPQVQPARDRRRRVRAAAGVAAPQPARLRQVHLALDAGPGRRGRLRRGPHRDVRQPRDDPPGAEAAGRRLEAGEGLDHQPGPGVPAKKNARDRLIRLAEAHPEWVVGYQDEVWWSRLARPAPHAWSDGEPLRLHEVAPGADDPDPKALTCYGILRGDTGGMMLRFVQGRPVSQVTEDFLAWACERLEAEGKRALLLVWDNAAWHVSRRVRAWIKGHSLRAKAEGGVRIVACYLPIKAPWLNAIEPKWVHGKRAIVEPGRVLTADEVEQRACGYYGCEQHDRLTQQVA